MTKKDLTLEGMSEEDFSKFRTQYLDQLTLSKESLLAIRIALELTPQHSPKFSVDCDEMHAHPYSCLSFSDRNSALYERLLNEIERYQRRLQEMGEKIDSALGIRQY